MRPVHVLIVTIALSMLAVAPVRAECVPGQFTYGCPIPLLPDPRPQPACKRHESRLDATHAGPWNALAFVPPHQPAPLDAVQAELKRIGGTRLVLALDDQEIHKRLLEQARDDVRRLLREARLTFQKLAIRDGLLEFAPRDSAAATMLRAIAPLTSGPFPSLEARETPDSVARGVLSFAVTGQTIAELRQNAEQAAIDIMGWRIRDIGVHTPVVQALGGGQILVLIPGLKDPARLLGLMPSRAQLGIRVVTDDAADPCVGAPPPDFRILRHRASTESLLVNWQSVVGGGWDVAASGVVRDAQTGTPDVVLRLHGQATHRLATATQSVTGRSLVLTLDEDIIAAAAIRESITDGAIRLSGRFTPEGATDLAAWLRLALASRLIVVERQIVEP